MAAVAIEVLVSYPDGHPKLAFVTNVLDGLGKFVPACDATVFAAFVSVASILAIDELMKQAGTDAVRAACLVVRRAQAWFQGRRRSSS